MLGDWNHFGISSTALGDLDGDGITEIAVGANGTDDGGSRRGAVWILFFNPDGTVKTQQKISSTQGGFPGILPDDSDFGRSVSSLGVCPSNHWTHNHGALSWFDWL